MAFTPPTMESLAQQRQQVTGPIGQSVLIAIVIVLFGWFLVRPAYSTYQEQHAALQAAKDQQAKVDTDKTELNRLISQLKSSDQEVKITDEALPLSGRITKVDVLIDTLAKSSGMQVAQLDAQNTGDIISAGNKAELKDPFGQTRSLQTSKVTVLVTGSIDQFKNFLQLLETSGRILDVSDMDVTAGDGTNRYRLTLKAYSYDVGVPVASQGAAQVLTPTN